MTLLLTGGSHTSDTSCVLAPVGVKLYIIQGFCSTILTAAALVATVTSNIVLWVGVSVAFVQGVAAIATAYFGYKVAQERDHDTERKRKRIHRRVP